MDFLDRIGRPLTRLAVMALMLAVTWILLRLGNAVANALEVALERWSRGEQVDWGGIAAPLTGIAAILTVMLPFIVSLYRDRRIERVEQIRAGAPPPPPLSPGPPLRPDYPDTWPNPHGGPNAP